MGIKGIYGEIGPGERIALSKLAIQKYEETGRPLRVAIDISIWQFQIQAGQGGQNPAIRTFYYRLLRLLSVSVQPLFVFDGPHKPPFKRNQRSGHHGASIPNLLCKQLLKLFGFPFHFAPGEAEAECALLQREGVVDAVLSEDVDTLMFGSGLTLRNWSSEGRGNKSPTHVSVYDAKATKDGRSGLDREGMILVALMSGGDYIPEGIPGAGIKVACEAARAGFGKALCQISRSDSAALDAWRAELSEEVRTNKSKLFRCKHNSLKIPDGFPNKEVLGYYTHPVVSSATKVQKIKDEILWDGDIDVPGLRQFVAEAFDWRNKVGAIKFVRGLAPVLLVHKLRLRGDRRNSGYGDVILTAIAEMELVRAICGRRVHFSNDGIPELRVVYHPNDIVGLNLEDEQDDSEDYSRDGLAPALDNEVPEAYVSDEPTSNSRSISPTKRGASTYDPTQPDKLWILETIAKIGIPLKVEDYEESLRDPKKFLKAKAAAKRAATKGGMPKGAMDKFVKVSKPVMTESTIEPTAKTRSTRAVTSKTLASALDRPSLRASHSEPVNPSQASAPDKTRKYSTRAIEKGTATISKAPVPKSSSRTTDNVPTPNANPWTLAKSSPSSYNGPRIMKNFSRQENQTTSCSIEPLVIHDLSSSPLERLPSPTREPPSTPSRKHAQSPQRFDIQEQDENSDPAQIHTTTTSRSERDQPSPRKKRSSISSSTHSSPVLPRNFRGTTEPLTPERPTLLSEFSSQLKARSSSPDLPSMQELLASSSKQVSQHDVIHLSSSPDIPRSPITTRRSESPIKRATKEKQNETEKKRPKEVKKRIILRDSLPGTWKEVNDEDIFRPAAGKSKKAWRMSQVETVDLSAD